jgi:hypothetical protein
VSDGHSSTAGSGRFSGKNLTTEVRRHRESVKRENRPVATVAVDGEPIFRIKAAIRNVHLTTVN